MSKSTIKGECAVRIAVRERPRMSTDGASPGQLPDGGEFIQRAGALTDNIIVVGDRPFAFDAVLGPTVGQSALYADLVEPMVGKLLSGFFCTVLAYGQTGTGKSFTMGLHAEAFNNEKGGIVPRVLVDIFERTEKLDENTDSEIYVSFIEIYNERVFDLLGNQSDDPVNTKGHKFDGGAKKRVHCLADAQRVLDEGNSNRHVRPTKMNPQSSRSHAIFTIHAMVGNRERRTESSMHLVDLAGSEGVRRTGHQGVALTEGVHINQGLLSIGKVLQALSVGNKVIPYRDSVLSSVLQDSLNHNSYLTLLACISPLKDDASETLSTLRFAQNAKSLRHAPQINAIISEIKKSRTPSKVKTPSKHLAAATVASPLRSRNKTPTPRKIPLAQSTAFKRRPLPPVFRNNTFCTPTKLVPGKVPSRFTMNVMSNRKPPVPSSNACDRESLFMPNQSEMFLDVSTSTVVDQTIVQPTTSYSPIVRRCVQQVEQNMGDQLRKMIHSMQADGTLAQQTMIFSGHKEEATNAETPHLACDSPNAVEMAENNQPCTSKNVANISWNTLRNELTQIVRREVQSAQHTTMCTLPAPTSLPPSEASSGILMSVEPSLVEDLTIISSTTTHAEETFALPDDPFKVPDVPSVAVPPLRRSTRRTINKTVIPTLPTRKSTRISTRLQPVVSKAPAKPARNANQGVRAKKTDEILATLKTAKNKSEAKNVQHALVLKMFNTASMKELQILPEIGAKMAYKIIAYRTSNPKLKTIEDISKMPIWRGRGWERFETLNYLK